MRASRVGSGQPPASTTMSGAEPWRRRYSMSDFEVGTPPIRSTRSGASAAEVASPRSAAS